MSTTYNNNNSTSSSTVRVDYSKYVADITGSPKAVRQTAVTGIGHHINPLHNPYSNQQSQPTQHQGTMPQYGGGNDKCPRCMKTVYLAEKKVGAGRPFHISCFNCSTCRRKLDSTILSEHKGEIYCKSCYTKQFGAHGLISGVTMSTEPATARRPSYGNDLDFAGTTNQQVRQRTSSKENIIYDDHRSSGSNQSATRYSQQNDYSPERNSSSRKSSDGIDAIVDMQHHRSSTSSPQKTGNIINAVVDTKYQKQSSSQNTNDVINAVVDTRYQRSSSSSSQKTNDAMNTVVDTKYQRSPSPLAVNNSNNNDQRHRSTHIEESDRHKYAHEGDKISYAGGTPAAVNIPVISHTKQPNTGSGVYDIPIERTGSYQRNSSRSSSTASTDSHRRQNSRERQIDFTDDYSRMNINDDKTRKHSTDFTLNVLPPSSPFSTRTHQTSSETRYSNTSVNSNNSNREQHHSRESSPITTINRYESSSPTTTGYTSSSTARTTSTTYRSSTSPTRTYTTQYERHSSGTLANPDNFTRRSPSPLANDRTSSGLTDFISKTNLVTNVPKSNSTQPSTLSNLANAFRPIDHANDDDY